MNKKVMVTLVIMGLSLGLMYYYSNNRISFNGLMAKDVVKRYYSVDYGKKKDLASDSIIREQGIYDLEGKYGCITIESNEPVKLNLKNVNIGCDNDSGIKVIGNTIVNINIEGNNKIVVFNNEIGEYDSSIYSKDSILFTGDGTLEINSDIKGIHSMKELMFSDGNYIINTKDNGIEGNEGIVIEKGNYDIVTSNDGMKTNNTEDDKGYIIIDDGIFKIKSENDGMDVNNYLYMYNGDMNIISGGGYLIKQDKSSKGMKAEKEIVIVNGKLFLNCSDDAIHSNNNINIYNGEIKINTGDDGIHGDKEVIVNNGLIEIANAYEGIEGASVKINNGDITINTKDDGINGRGIKENKEQEEKERGGLVEVNGGLLKISAKADGIDSNGKIIINNGEMYIEGATIGPNSALDYYELDVNGGTLFATGSIGVKNESVVSGTQPTILITLNKKANGLINVEDVKYEPKNTYQSIIVSNNKLKYDKEVTVSLGINNKKIKLEKQGMTVINNFME